MLPRSQSVESTVWTATQCAARALVAVAVCVVIVSAARSEENCCERGIWNAPFQLPPGNQVDWSEHFASSFGDPFHSFLPGIHCPVEVRLCRAPEEDYRFVGEVKPEGHTQVDHNGALRGTFIASVRLVDPENGNAVLRESRTISWTGLLEEGMNHKIDWYEPSADSRNESWVNPVGGLAEDFSDINNLIYDYERKPQRCRVALPEGSGDTVQAGTTVPVSLSEILDHLGRPTQPWQRILVKVEKGTITNAEARWGDLYVFRARELGTGGVQYRAPEACKPDRETLTVFNTCIKKESHKSIQPGPEIGKKQFNIVCDQWDVTITYKEDVGGSYEPGKDHKVTVQRNYSGTFKARVRLVKRDSRTATYESTDADVQIKDNYNHHSVMENGKCAWRGGFNGDKSGRMPIKVAFRLNSHNHTYHVGLGKWDGDGTTYTLGGNLFGTLEGCDGAWQQEVNCSDLPRGWEKGEGPPENRTWAPGQTSFTFQNSWDDPVMTGIWPQRIPGPPPRLSGMAPAAYRLTYALAVLTGANNPHMTIKKSLSWSVTRPK